MEGRRKVLDDLSPAPGTNAGLWLDRGLRALTREGSWKQEHFDALQEIRVPAEYRTFFARWNMGLSRLPGTKRATLESVGRMVVGLGAESILETSVTLHKTYGVPYIPGSALKGLTAAAAHKNFVDESWKKVTEEGGMGESHRVMFGDTKSSGYVVFHDALWIPEGDRLPLDLDVMTVHHPGYYQTKANSPAPSEWDNPKPIAFLSARGTYLLALTGPEDWTMAALKILTDAIARDGIGAKTAAGYGRMNVRSATSQ